MSDGGTGAITQVQVMWQRADSGSVVVAERCDATLVARATDPVRDRCGDLPGRSQANRAPRGGASEICTGFVTDERLPTANAAERPQGRSAAFLQVSGCSSWLFGVVERPQPEARLDVVVLTD